MGFTARYSGTCGACDGSIEIGTKIRSRSGKPSKGYGTVTWVHETCPARWPASGNYDELDRPPVSEPCHEGLGESGIDPDCGIHFDSPNHPENAEAALALMETGCEDELAHWASHFPVGR